LYSLSTLWKACYFAVLLFYFLIYFYLLLKNVFNFFPFSCLLFKIFFFDKWRRSKICPLPPPYARRGGFFSSPTLVYAVFNVLFSRYSDSTNVVELFLNVYKNCFSGNPGLRESRGSHQWQVSCRESNP
jgi:hypothetical protein